MTKKYSGGTSHKAVLRSIARDYHSVGLISQFHAFVLKLGYVVVQRHNSDGSGRRS